MTIINLTPHTINICNASGEIIREIPASGQLCRVSSRTVQTGEIDGIPVTETQFGDVENLPAPQDGTVFIVSLAVASRVPERQDVFVPSESVRDAQGRIIGCKSLGRV